MNKLMAMLFLLGALAGFGLSQSGTYTVQDQTAHGAPASEPRTVYVKNGDRVFFIAFGAVSMAGCLYFVAKIRQEDLRQR
jgi:hypothetical protein